VKQPVARAQSGCSVASFKGSYSLSVSGTFYDVNGFAGVYASSGLAVADGAGAIIGSDTLNYDGTPTRGRQFVGTYTINSDCTGAMNLKDLKNAPIVNMDLVIVNGGKDIELVDNDPDMILTGTARLQ
jgi:hypothetical protein